MAYLFGSDGTPLSKINYMMEYKNQDKYGKSNL